LSGGWFCIFRIVAIRMWKCYFRYRRGRGCKTLLYELHSGHYFI